MEREIHVLTKYGTWDILGSGGLEARGTLSAESAKGSWITWNETSRRSSGKSLPRTVLCRGRAVVKRALLLLTFEEAHIAHGPLKSSICAASHMN